MSLQSESVTNLMLVSQNTDYRLFNKRHDDLGNIKDTSNRLDVGVQFK